MFTVTLDSTSVEYRNVFGLVASNCIVQSDEAGPWRQEVLLRVF